MKQKQPSICFDSSWFSGAGKINRPDPKLKNGTTSLTTRIETLNNTNNPKKTPRSIFGFYNDLKKTT
jgi:hypothetical protein